MLAYGRHIAATECIAFGAEGMINRCFFSLLLLTERWFFLLGKGRQSKAHCQSYKGE